MGMMTGPAPDTCGVNSHLDQQAMVDT